MMHRAAARALSSAWFAARVGQPRDLRPGELVGVEHEYRVWRRRRAGSVRLDARRLGQLLSSGEPDLDPADPHARRQRSGGVLTCDGPEVEISIAPVPVVPGFAWRAARRSVAEERRLRRALRPPHRLDGYSTHLSVALPDRLTDATARLYVSRFAPALMLLMDGPSAPGLLVRPRPGRIELGASHVPAGRLPALLAFALGSVLACAEVVSAKRGAERRLPPSLELAVEPARDRYGWYVDRRAPGCDLYALGRAASLRLATGGRLSAQRHLEAAWASARHLLGPLATAADLAQLDALVAGRLPLAVEGAAPSGPAGTRIEPPGSTADEEAGGAFGAALAPTGGRLHAAPVLLTWSRAVFLVLDPRRERPGFASVPVSRLARFLGLLGDGSLDVPVERFLGIAGPLRRLDDPARAARAGLHDALGPRIALLPAERPTSPEPFADGWAPRPARAPSARPRWAPVR